MGRPENVTSGSFHTQYIIAAESAIKARRKLSRLRATIDCQAEEIRTLNGLLAFADRNLKAVRAEEVAVKELRGEKVKSAAAPQEATQTQDQASRDHDTVVCERDRALSERDDALRSKDQTEADKLAIDVQLLEARKESAKLQEELDGAASVVRLEELKNEWQASTIPLDTHTALMKKHDREAQRAAQHDSDLPEAKTESAGLRKDLAAEVAKLEGVKNELQSLRLSTISLPSHVAVRKELDQEKSLSTQRYKDLAEAQAESKRLQIELKYLDSTTVNTTKLEEAQAESFRLRQELKCLQNELLNLKDFTVSLATYEDLAKKLSQVQRANAIALHAAYFGTDTLEKIAQAEEDLANQPNAAQFGKDTLKGMLPRRYALILPKRP